MDRMDAGFTLIEGDAEISSHVSPDQLAEAFDLDSVLQYVDVLFERLAALGARKEHAHV